MRRRSDYVRNARPRRSANAVSASHQSLQDLSYRPTSLKSSLSTSLAMLRNFYYPYLRANTSA